MASASRGESSNPYGGGLGTGGKFRKPTARRSQKTPYERPPASVRSSGVGGREGRGGGWLSKLVDPAQRLITYSAHKLFASVFRKRLVSGETPVQSPEQKQLPERDVIQETRIAHTESTPAVKLSMGNDVVRIQEANASGNPGKDGFTDLEKILKEKTFTSSEVDRLTALLRSKATVSPTVNGDQRNASNLRHPPSHERDSAHPDNGSVNPLVSTPLENSRALDQCIDSPAQLAKAYMGSRPSEITPSMLGMRGQAVREDSVFLNRTPFPSKSPTTSLVPKLSGQRPLENGFVTPRTRGRSAVYSMARTPYSRPQSTLQIGSLFRSSPSTWEESLSSGSRHGFQSGLKRRSSVFDNGLGSVGPVRRIRQKSNLSSRTALPASESPLSVRASGGQNITHTSKDSTEDIPSSSFNLVPSASKEAALKIFQQLDRMESTKEKSPSKLSSSMLRGPALKSLQNVDAVNFLDNIPEKKENSPVASHQKQEKSGGSGSKEFLALSEKTGSAADVTNKAGSSKGQETRGKGAYLPPTSSLEEHPPKQRAFRMIADEEFLELEDDHGAAPTPFEEAERQNLLKVEKGAGMSVPKGEKLFTSSEALASTSYTPNGDASQSTSNGSLETGRSQFSALPMESVKQSNMPSDPTLNIIQGNEKSSISPAKLTSGGEYVSREEPKKAAAVFPNTFLSPVSTDFLNQSNGTSAAIKVEKPSSFSFGVSEAFGKPTESKKTVSNSASKAESTLNGSIFSDGENVISQPQMNGSLGSNPSFSSSISNIPSKNSGSEVQCTVQSFAATPTAPSLFGKLPANTSNDISSGNNQQSTPALPLSSTSSFKFEEPAAAPLPVSSGQVSKETEVKNPTFGNINSFKFGGTASADTSTENSFAAKTSENKSTTGFMFGSSYAVADAGKISFGGTSSATGGSTLNPSSAASSAPGSSTSLVFGVSSSTPTTGTESSKFSGNFAATTGSNIFGTSSPAFTSSSVSGGVAASTPSSVFGFNAVSSTSAASSQSQASNLFGAASGQTGNTGSGTTTTTQSASFQFGSSASAPSFGLSGNNTSTNSSPFGLSKSEPAVFATGSTPQLSSTNLSSSSSGTTSSSLFGTNWQAPKPTPAFGSSLTTSSTPAFSFGASSAATASSASAPITFGFNSTAPAIPQQSVFGNSAPSVTPPSQSPFGNSTSGFTFGATAPPPNNTNGFNNNQQMSMEDSMAEDTDQANKTSMVQQPVFGQQPFSMPQPTFNFGGGAPPATPPPSMANPFQFGGQPIASTPAQNASPFQASQSLEFQGGGSFSLGSTGGGDKSARRIFKAKKSNRKK